MINIHTYNVNKQVREEKRGKVTQELKQKTEKGDQNMGSEEKTAEEGTMCNNSKNCNMEGN